MLIDHDGKFIKDVGWFWDHAEGRNKIAHDYLFVNYVCTSGKHYPLEYSLLMSQLKQGHAKDWALCRLTTIGEASRAMLNETLRTTLAWVIEQATIKSRSYDHIVAKLGLT